MINYEQQELERFLLENLNATEDVLKEWEENPYLIDGELVRQFWDTVRNAPAVAIVGDYDCDGICASMVMMRGVKEVCPDKRVLVRIPRRFSEGYGINQKIIDEIKEKLPVGSAVVTVDNGIAAADLLEGLEKDGYPVLMTDHHELREGTRVPNVKMAIDPSVPETAEGFSFTKWCGAAVAFKLCEQMVSKEKAKEMEVYAGIATVADCMQLRGGNWGLVRKAVNAFREEKAPASLYNMLCAMKQDPKFANEDTFGFYLGPCFNAAGRLEDTGAAKVLSYLHKPTIEKLEELVGLNDFRKKLRDMEFEQVKEYIKDTKQEDSCPIYVSLPGLHEGIVGILAGKVAEEYGVPAIVVTESEKEGILKGSARSVGDFNIFQFLSASADLFERMGGHAGAAGLSIQTKNWEELIQRRVDKEEVKQAVSAMQATHIDPYHIPEINRILCRFRPFGEGNPAPLFEMDINLKKEGGRLIGNEKNHLCIDGPDRAYKIMHFFHTPNDLTDQNVFGMTGYISGSSFAGIETPTFNAESVHDIAVIREAEAVR